MNRKRKAIASALGVWLVAALLTGCSAESREWFISTFFDEAKGPPPPTRRVRRDLLGEIEDLKRQLAESEQKLAAALDASKAAQKAAEEGGREVEKAKSWQEAAKLLPKDKSGQVDWVEAIAKGVIAPRPGFDAKGAEQAVMDMDIELASSPKKLYAAVFSHSAHTRWLTCKNCHPDIFPLRQPKPTAVTMASIRAGQYCGVCHGKVAFGVEKDCSRCHANAKFPASAEWRPSEEPRKPIEKARTWAEAEKLLPVTGGVVDWPKALKEGVIAPRPGIGPKAEEQAVLPLTLELTPKEMPAMKAVFPHETHTTLLGCDSCHPALFQMQAGTTPITMEKINAGEYCGVCHGKVAFPATACGRCHPAMAGG